MAVSDKKTKRNIIIFAMVSLLVIIGLLSLVFVAALSGTPGDGEVLNLEITTDGETLEEADVPQILEGVVPDGEVIEGEVADEDEKAPLPAIYYDDQGQIQE